MEAARQELIHLLRLAYSGELAAAMAYRGHARSVWNVEERDEIRAIEEHEWDHRKRVGAILHGLGSRPSRVREIAMFSIGAVINVLCLIGKFLGPFGWFVAMYGAGRLERNNVEEYVVAMRHAEAAGLEHLLADLYDMARVEWEHERYFRQKCETCRRLSKWFPTWPASPALPPAPGAAQTRPLGAQRA